MLGLLGELVTGFRNGIRAGGDPNDERYWQSGYSYGTTGVATTGITVTPQVAFQVSCFFQGVRLRAETIGTLPLRFYREDSDGSRNLARDYWLRPILDTKRGRANPWQTAQQFRETMAARAVAWGGGYAEIRQGTAASGQVIELWPLDNERLKIEQLGDGRLRFTITRDDGRQEALPQELIFRVEGLALHRFMPAAVLGLARECIGAWLAVEKYEGLFFAQGARPSLFMEHPGKPTKETKDAITENLRKWQGLSNMHRIYVGDQGMKLQSVGFSPRDSMLPEVRRELALEVARWLNMPAHMLRAGGSGSGAQEAAASMEQLAQEYVDYTVRPDSVRWESAYHRDLIDEDDIVVEHNLEGLLRGDVLKRFQSYAIGIMNAIYSENEVREKEGLNRVDGLDEPRRSVNQDRGAEPRQVDRQTDPRQTQPPQGAAPRRLRLIAGETAGRVVRRELAAIHDKGARFAGKPDEWAAWVTAFYAEHRAHVAEALQLEAALARLYADRHREALLAGGLGAAAEWETAAVDELVALTLEESTHV